MTRIEAAFIAVWKKGASSETSHSKTPFRWRVTPRRVTWFWLECFGCNYWGIIIMISMSGEETHVPKEVNICARIRGKWTT